MNCNKWIKYLKVGDEVFVVEDRSYYSGAKNSLETVTNIGRKYIFLNGRRQIEIETGMEKKDKNTGVSPSRIYPNEYAYLRKLETERRRIYLYELFKSSGLSESLINKIYTIVENERLSDKTINRMESKFIRVRVEHPQPKKEDIELMQDVVSYHIFNLLKLEGIGLRGFRQYDLEIDVKVKPVLELKEIPANVWTDDLKGLFEYVETKK